MKIKLEIEINTESDTKELISDSFVDTLEELTIVYKSEARENIEEFISQWSSPKTLVSIKLEE